MAGTGSQMVSRMRTAACGATIVVLLIGVAARAAAGEKRDDVNLQKRAAELVRLRTDVERLSTKVDLEKAEMRQELASLAQQQSDLERQIKSQETRLAQIETEIAKHEGIIAEDRSMMAALKPVMERYISSGRDGTRVGTLRKYVTASLPFKITERLGQLDELAEMLATNKLAPERALAKLWSVVEDELRLARENGLYSQDVVIDGESVLVDVARLGMVCMYVRTKDGRHGMTVRDGDGWRHAIVTGPDERRIKYLFESLKKHVREGYFELPNPYRATQRESAQ